MKSRSLAVFLVFLLVFSLVGLAAPPTPTNAAVSGTVLLKNGKVLVSPATAEFGAEQAYFSTNDPYNWVGVELADADLNVGRTGQARLSLTAARGTTGSGAFNLKGIDANAVAVLLGEAERTQTFNGLGTTPGAYALTKPARDKDTDPTLAGFGAVTVDDVIVKVGGVVLATANYTVTVVTGAITTVNITAAADNPVGVGNVAVIYKTSEYDQTTPASTPIAGVSAVVVAYGAAFATATNQKGLDSIDATNGTITTISDVANGQKVIITFTYHVVDTLKSVSITSSSATAVGKSRTVNVVESAVGVLVAANSGVFRAKIQLTKDLNDACLEPVSNADSVGCGDPVIGDLVYFGRLYVKDGDTITVTYSDASPAGTATDTAFVDLKGPTVTLVEPAHKSSKGVQIFSLAADVTDAASGVEDPANAGFVLKYTDPAAVTTTTAASKTPISGGFRVSFMPGVNLVEGAYSWWIEVKDKVGNAPKTTNTTAKDIGDICGNTAALGGSGNKHKVNVDIGKPTIAAAKTGVGAVLDTRTKTWTQADANVGDQAGKTLANLGLDVGNLAGPVKCSTYNKYVDNGVEIDPATGKAIGDPVGTVKKGVRVDFAPGFGGASLDKATIAAADFSVGGLTPAKVTVQTNAVYLTMPSDMATDARPSVQVVGPISDAAGNALDPATLTQAEKDAKVHLIDNATDGIVPTLSITVVGSGTTGGVPVSKDKFVISVITSEALTAAPALNECVAANADSKCDTEALTALPAMALVAANKYEATYTFGAGTVEVKRVLAVGTDTSVLANQGKATVDIEKDGKLNNAAAPVVSPANGVDVPSSSPWITVSFAAESGEYAVMYAGGSADTHKKVYLTAATLDGVDVLSKFFTADSINYTMATSGLALGTRTWTIAFKDEAGNASVAGVAGTTTFTFNVVQKPAIEIALAPGWNLVSVPAPLDDPSITSVFAGMTTVQRVYGFDATVGWQLSVYDAATKKWSGSLVEIRDGKGYWVYSTGAAPIKVFAAERQPTTPLPQYDLKAGWNLIGFTALAGEANMPVSSYLASLGTGTAQKWTSLVSFSPNPAIGYQSAKSNTIYSAGFDTMDVDPGAPVVLNAAVAQGKGYWIYLTADMVLVP